MDFGTLAIFFGVIGIIGIGIGLLVKYTGMGEIFQIIGHYINAFFQAVGRILSFAPRPLQIAFFLVIGIALMGTVVSYFLGLNVVCADRHPYTGDVLDVQFAKMFPSNSQKIDKSLVEGRPQSISTGKTVQSGASLLMAPFTGTTVPVQAPTFMTWGTFFTEGSHLLPAGYGVNDKIYMAVPPSTSATNTAEGLYDSFMAISDPASINDKLKNLKGTTTSFPVKVVKETWASAKWHNWVNPGGLDINYVDGECYLWSITHQSLATSFVMGDDILEVTYSFQQDLSDDNRLVTNPYVSSPAQYFWSRTLANCPQTQGAGMILLQAGAMDDPSTTSDEIGYVHAAYVTLDDVQQMFKDVSEGKMSIDFQLNPESVSSRKAFIQGVNSQKIVFEDAPIGGSFITYSCSAKDDVQIGVFGLENVFSVEVLLVLIAGVGLLGVLRVLGVWGG